MPWKEQVDVTAVRLTDEQLEVFQQTIPQRDWGAMYRVALRCARLFDPARGCFQTLMLVSYKRQLLDRKRFAKRRQTGDAWRHQLIETLPIADHRAPKEQSDHPMPFDQIPRECADIREAVELVFGRGLKYHAAAYALRIPLGTLKSRVSRGLDLMRLSAAGSGL